MPSVIADPYDVQLVDQDFGADVLKPLSDLQLDWDEKKVSRWVDLGDGWMVVDHLERFSGKYPRWEGAIQRTVNDEHPHRSGPTVGTKPLNLPDGVGLGEHVGFLYDETAKLFWLQRDRRVVGKMLLGDYLRGLTGVSFSMVIRLREDSLKRARKLKTIRRIEFAYMTSDHAKPKGALERMLDKFRGFGAARIEVTLSPVRGGTLDPSAKEAVATILDAYEEDPDAIAKAQILGRVEEDAEDDFVDLIRDRPQMSVNIAKNRSRDPLRLISAVRDVWSANRAKV